jgi:hypothetical protein
MRRLTTSFAIALGISLLSIAVADACGDKLLTIGRGARFQRSMHPATVLIYLPSSAPSEAATKAPKLQAFLKKAGHKPNLVQSVDQLGQVLGSRQYDVVLTDLADVGSVQRQAEASASKLIIVPMIFSASKAEVATAKKHYHFIVKNPNDGDEYLDAIEEAMRSRMRAKS